MSTNTWQTKYNDTKLDQMRQMGDPIADAVAAELKRKKPSHMVDELFERAAKEAGVFQAFLEHMNTVPDWVDWEQIEQGRRVSLAFANVRAMSLLVSSLMEGHSIAKGAEVLVSTGRLNQDVVKRLNETGQMTHNMHEENGLKPGGKAHRTIMEVRLLHAMVRKHLKQRGWDYEQFDEPINQEDMAFTIIEFDHLAYRGMEKMGVSLSQQDRNALHHLWKYAAYLNGVDDFFQTASPDEEAFQYQVITRRQQHPSENSKRLANDALQSVGGLPPFYLSSGFLYELSRLCIGDKLADHYQYPRSAQSRLAIKAIQRFNKAATWAHYHLPGNKKLSEQINFRMFQQNLSAGIEKDPMQRAFRHIA